MPTIDETSVDMVMADPPYGTTACKWDSVIPFVPMWAGIKHATKKNAAIVMTASQPFTSALAMSNAGWFRYCWVWDKVTPSGFNYARFQPMRRHEDVVVFYQKAPRYDSQGERFGRVRTWKMASSASESSHMTHTRTDCTVATHARKHSVITIPKIRKGWHPTEKPVALMEYLIQTYTKPGETVLDFTMGSGTTGVACANTGRKFIGIELDPGHFAIASERIAKAFAMNEGKHVI